MSAFTLEDTHAQNHANNVSRADATPDDLTRPGLLSLPATARPTYTGSALTVSATLEN